MCKMYYVIFGLFADWCIDSSRNKNVRERFVWFGYCVFFSLHIYISCCFVVLYTQRWFCSFFFIHLCLSISLTRMYFVYIKWSQWALCLLCSAFGIIMSMCIIFSQCWLDIIVNSQMIRFFRLPQNNMMNYTLFSAFCLLYKCYSIRWWSASRFTFNSFILFLCMCIQKRLEIVILWNSFVFVCNVCNNKFGTFPMYDDKLTFICLFSSSIEFKNSKIFTFRK